MHVSGHPETEGRENFGASFCTVPFMRSCLFLTVHRTPPTPRHNGISLGDGGA